MKNLTFQSVDYILIEFVSDSNSNVKGNLKNRGVTVMVAMVNDILVVSFVGIQVKMERNRDNWMYVEDYLRKNIVTL